jgi:transposase
MATSSSPLTRKPNTELPLAVRGAIVVLKAIDADPNLPFTVSSKQIAQILGVSPGGVNQVYKRACERGFDPSHIGGLVDRHVTTAARSGAPRKMKPSNHEAIAQNISLDRYARKKSVEVLSWRSSSKEHQLISYNDIWRLLTVAGCNKTKPTRMPDLISKMKLARLAFCKTP